MSKTTQENKAKKAKLAVEASTTVSEQKAPETAVENTTTEASETSTDLSAVAGSKIIKSAKVRGKKYLEAKKKVDITKWYPLKKAVELVKTTSISKFDGKVEAHLTVTEEGNLGEITFPHLEASAKKVVILNDTILTEIKDGKINFDVLIATPATMPKLLAFAKVLGPKGLMPNPKNGTLTDKPEEAVKRLSVAKTMVKTEKKALAAHIVVGKVSQPAEELIANVEELIKVVKAPRLKKLVLCATMGPAVKVEVEK